MSSTIRNLVIMVVLAGLSAATVGAGDFRDAATITRGGGIRLEFVSYVGL